MAGRFEKPQSEYIEKVVYLNRVSKTVKGGRVMKFSALMVVGDGKGKVGFGLGKAAEVPEAIRKGLEDAKKNMMTITTAGTTIPHEVIGEFGAGRVMLKPAAEGTGIIAGGPVRAVMEAAGIKAGDTVIDVCAAPGGKAIHAAGKLAGTGQVIACDLTAYKTSKIEANRDRMQINNLSVVIQDAREREEKLVGRADVLLVDVPCSGLGVIGKKQDIKYRVTRQSLQDIVRLQREIVGNVVQYLKPEGVMMYSTCTMNPEENEKMVEWICREFAMETVGMQEELPDALKPLGEKGFLQLLPGIHEADGFFIAKLRRREQAN